MKIIKKKTSMNNTFFYDTLVGKLGITSNGTSITEVYYAENIEVNNIIIKETRLIKKAACQLKAYLKGDLKTFDLPLKPMGSEFQKKVWQALETIPYGQTWTYKELAEAIGSPKASRAVGGANNKNPLSIIIPCHRVIGASGDLVGYNGGLEIKKYLLNLESKNK